MSTRRTLDGRGAGAGAGAPVAAAGAVPAERARLQKRTLRVLVVAQVFAGAGLAAGVSVGALLAKDVLGSTSTSGLPAALFTAGSAGAALVVGRLSDRYGRRIGLTAGYLTGAVGGAGVVVAGVTSNVPLLLLALIVYGAGSATNLQCRYAGADLADPEHHGRAISTVLVATTLGAVAGPNLLRQTGDHAVDAGIPRLTGPFVLATVAYATAGVVLAALLRPDPLLSARRFAASTDPSESPLDDTLSPEVVLPIERDPAMIPDAHQPVPTRVSPLRRVVLAAAAMVLAQGVMVGVMSMTPVHLEDHRHGLGVIGLVIAIHIAFMYLPSPITGRLVDRWTPTPVIAAGGMVLIASALVAAASGSAVGPLAVGLALLGLGWNLTLVAGTATVTDLTALADRARTQGTVDLGVALGGAVGGISSGAILAATSFQTLGLVGAALAVFVLPAAAAGRRTTRSATA